LLFPLLSIVIRIGREIGVDPDVILATSHGRRSIDVLQIYEPKLANWDYITRVEGLIPREFGADAVEIPGSRALLDHLNERSIPWSIVTSGTRPLVTGWLDVLKLAHPQNLVTAEDVKNGKPGMFEQRLLRTRGSTLNFQKILLVTY
jgi:glycerol 3-phosphatase-1